MIGAPSSTRNDSEPKDLIKLQKLQRSLSLLGVEPSKVSILNEVSSPE